MRLELTDEEATVLRELLETYLGGFYLEISHTDNPGYQHRLTTRGRGPTTLRTGAAETPLVR